MDSQRIAIVQRTWPTILAQSEQAAQFFYDRLFALAPESRPLFAHADLPSLGKKFIATLGQTVEALANLPGELPGLRELGSRHAQWGVFDGMYEAATEAVLDAIGQILGPTFTTAVHDAWEEALSLVITAMRMSPADRVAIVARLATASGFIEPAQEDEFLSFCRDAIRRDPSKTAEEFAVAGGYVTASQAKRLRQAATASTFTCLACGWDGLGQQLIVVKNTVMCPVCARPAVSLRVAAQPPVTPATKTPPEQPAPPDWPTPFIADRMTGAFPISEGPVLIAGTLASTTVLEVPPGEANRPAITPHLDMLAPGVVVADCRIEMAIGEGGMGHVYRAEDIHLRRKVALKFLGPEWLRSASQMARFEQEARVLAQLEHPNIVQIYRMGRLDDWPFVVLQWVDGESLGTCIRISHGPLPVAMVVDCLLQTARGLNAAHAAGVIHRDVKPENVLIAADGTVKVADFGLAKHEQMNLGVSRTGMVVGTPAYASPEQLAARPVDFRTDIYSFGILAFHALTGTLPFAAESVGQLILQHETSPLPPIRAKNPRTPPALESLIVKMCSKEPANRPAKMADIIAALAEIRDRL